MKRCTYLEDFSLIILGYILVFNADDLLIRERFAELFGQNLPRLLAWRTILEPPLFSC
jgi:hypothetical protein